MQIWTSNCLLHQLPVALLAHCIKHIWKMKKVLLPTIPIQTSERYIQVCDGSLLCIKCTTQPPTKSFTYSLFCIIAHRLMFHCNYNIQSSTQQRETYILKCNVSSTNWESSVFVSTKMSFNYYTPINKLNPSKIKWNIRVRVQALWKGITRETKEFRGLNLILVDDSVSDYYILIHDSYFFQILLTCHSIKIFFQNVEVQDSCFRQRKVCCSVWKWTRRRSDLQLIKFHCSRIQWCRISPMRKIW